MTRVGGIERKADGLAMVEFDGDVRLWSRATIRKPTRCAATGVWLKPGDLAYRPVGNQQYRGARIAASEVDG